MTRTGDAQAPGTRQDEFRRQVARWLAMPMFVLACVFLALIAGAIQRLAGPTYRNQPLELGPRESLFFLAALLVVWLIFWAELAVEFMLGGRRTTSWRALARRLSVCLCPPLRICLRHSAMDGKLWIPWLGWQEVGEALCQRLERFFSVPMIGFALLILPVLTIEYFWAEKLDPDKHLWLVVTMDLSTALIWMAFTVEFVLMCSVAENKLSYCRLHWVDLAIILLPLIAFARALRLARAVRLTQVGRMSRLYRLRGLAMRGYRAVLILELFDRLLGASPERQLRDLKARLLEKERELADLRQRIAALEALLAARAEESPAVLAKDSGRQAGV